MPFHVTDSSPAASPLQLLQAAMRPVATVRAKPGLLVAGATGVLGSEVLQRLAGSGGFAYTQVLAREPITPGLQQVGITLVGAGDIATWPVCPVAVQTAVVMFEPSRLYHERERALWTPVPGQLLALAHWLRRCGVQTLVLVLPHAQGSLPQALMQGLASIDEQAVTTLGFERVLLVRSAQKPGATVGAGTLDKLAAWMLSISKFMIPASAQPLRPAKLAEFVDVALRVLPAGTHVAGPELLWQAAQARDMHSVVSAWLNTTEPTSATS